MRERTKVKRRIPSVLAARPPNGQDRDAIFFGGRNFPRNWKFREMLLTFWKAETIIKSSTSNK